MAKDTTNYSNWKRVLAIIIFVLQSVSEILDRLQEEEEADSKKETDLQTKEKEIK